MVVGIVVRTIPTTGLPLHQPLTTLPILTTDLLGAHRDARAVIGRPHGGRGVSSADRLAGYGRGPARGTTP